ncbi:hypothetical protein LCL85_00030 [Vibrio alginolyticus]|nr:hypothetical protein [Vibrio alginolyticus]
MKLSKISLGIGLSVLAATPVIAADPTATVDVFSTVEQTCNIGVVFGGATEAGVGGADIGSDEVLGEINDITDGNDQVLTGYANCNSPGGFQVLAKLDKGALVNTTNDTYYIKYELENTSSDLVGGTLPGTGGPYDYVTSEFLVGNSVATTDTKQFQLKMKNFDTANGGIAGSYAEKVTYRLTAL